MRMRAWAGRLVGLLCPATPRRIPGRRALDISLRTAHLSTFGALLGGHLFGVDPARLSPFLVATAVTGVSLVALELASTCAWLLEGRGLMVLAKLAVLALVPVFWEQRVLLLLLVVVIASVGSHMPARFRHRAFFQRSNGQSGAPAAPASSGLEARPRLVASSGGRPARRPPVRDRAERQDDGGAAASVAAVKSPK